MHVSVPQLLGVVLYLGVVCSGTRSCNKQRDVACPGCEYHNSGEWCALGAATNKLVNGMWHVQDVAAQQWLLLLLLLLLLLQHLPPSAIPPSHPLLLPFFRNPMAVGSSFRSQKSPSSEERSHHCSPCRPRLSHFPIISLADPCHLTSSPTASCSRPRSFARKSCARSSSSNARSGFLRITVACCPPSAALSRIFFRVGKCA